MDIIDEITEYIRNSEEKIVQTINNNKINKYKVEKIPLNFSVSAVDGGILYERFHGVDICLYRSVGVVFEYNEGKIKSHKYHPSKFPKNSAKCIYGNDDLETNSVKSLIRLSSELECSIQLIEKYNPKVLLIDGSLMIHPMDRISEGSNRPYYERVLDLLEQLKKKETLIIGIIKDSRSKILTSLFNLDCSDSLFCEYLLKKGERSEIIESNESTSAFYLRPSENDLPIRVEFFGSDIEKVAAIAFSLCQISESFAYPAVLIEADMCATLNPKEIEHIKRKLFLLKPLRRNNRPFR